MIEPGDSTFWAEDASWTYIRRSEGVQDVFWTFYVRSIYVLVPWNKYSLLTSTLSDFFKIQLQFTLPSFMQEEMFMIKSEFSWMYI